MKHADVGGGIRQKVLAAIASCNSEGGGRQSTQATYFLAWFRWVRATPDRPATVRFPGVRCCHRCPGFCSVTLAGWPMSRYRSGPVRVNSGWDELIRPPADAGL